MTLPFFPITPLAFDVGIKIPVDLYVQHAIDASPVHVLSFDDVLDAGKLARIENKRLLAPADTVAKQELRRLFRQQLETAIEDGSMAPLRKAAIIVETLRGDIDEAFTSRTTRLMVETARRWGKLLIELLPPLCLELNDYYGVLQHDGHLGSQATNLSIYSFILASSFQFDDKELEEFLMGAILCDVGRIELPEDTTAGVQQNHSTDASIPRSHAADGFNRLVRDAIVTRPQLMMAYQHHERLDGSGYPVGIPGELIHPWAKMLAIVDTFENLTCARPQRGTVTRRQALTTMRQEAGITIDLEHFRCWESQILEPTKT
jgi:HD-GYP domain-containing protein (c-di-GMP phosphodiesterase class II)